MQKKPPFSQDKAHPVNATLDPIRYLSTQILEHPNAVHSIAAEVHHLRPN